MVAYEFFYSEVEPFSKYYPVKLHLSPATRNLNENPVVTCIRVEALLQLNMNLQQELSSMWSPLTFDIINFDLQELRRRRNEVTVELRKV